MLGERIRSIRRNKGMNKTEFGKLFGASGSLVNKWETNKVVPSEERLKQISELMGITIEELINNENPLGQYSEIELLNELLRRQK